MMDKLWKLIDGGMDRLLKWVERTPSTNLRLVVTIFLWFFTGMNVNIRFWTHGSWESPPLDWIIALGIMLGLDTVQYLGKRKTHKKFADDEENPKENLNAGV